MRQFFILGLAASALGSALQAQEATNSGIKLSELLPYQKAFTNLPAEKRENFIKHQRESSRLFSEKRIIETLEALKLAQKEFDRSPETWNLRGSCYVEMRAFEKALACYAKAAEITGKNPSIQFNIAEIYFVTHEWQKAHDALEALLDKLPENRPDLARISEFKLMLCKLKIGEEQAARELADKYDFLDDSPYHYFAKAALAYERDDVTEAQEWIARAVRIFRDPAILAPWRDTMVEYGHIKSFYGNNQ